MQRLIKIAIVTCVICLVGQELSARSKGSINYQKAQSAQCRLERKALRSERRIIASKYKHAKKQRDVSVKVFRANSQEQKQAVDKILKTLHGYSVSPQVEKAIIPRI